jgi:flagellin-like hook-associated protein FlgL
MSDQGSPPEDTPADREAIAAELQRLAEEHARLLAQQNNRLL